MTPIAAWLKASRLSQTHPETGRPWSQAYLAERMSAETGWTLYREAYVGYEQGKGMLPETLARFVDFWAKRGVDAPDLSEPAPALSLEERAVIAAERQAAAAERQATAVEAMVAMFVGRAPDPTVVEAMQAWGQAALARSQSPAPLDAPTPTTER